MSNTANDGTAVVSPPFQTAPRLSAALVNAPIGGAALFRTTLEQAIFETKDKPVDPTSFNGDRSKLLKHLVERLDIGLAEAWWSTDGYGQAPELATNTDPLRDSPDAAGAAAKFETALQAVPARYAIWDVAEERWARAFTETFLYSAYGGPGVEHGIKDADMYSAFVGNGVYPIVTACQQLATFMILSRGFSVSDVSDGPPIPLPTLPPGLPVPSIVKAVLPDTKKVTVGCGCSGGTFRLNVFKGHSRWYSRPNGSGKTVAHLFQEATKYGPQVTPGTVAVFNPGGPDYGNQDKGTMTHVGAVLRMHETTGVQFMDTGVLVGGNGTSAECGTVDQSFATQFPPNAQGDLIGFAYLPQPNEADLLKCAQTLIAAKPLGLVRCVVLETTDPSAPIVRFVSKLLPMRYPPARYIWSLRNLPASGLTVLWYIYNPVGDLAKAMGAAGITSLPALPITAPPALGAVAGLAAGALGAFVPGLPAAAASLISKKKGEIAPKIVVQGDGKTLTFWRRATHPDTGHFNGTYDTSKKETETTTDPTTGDEVTKEKYVYKIGDKKPRSTRSAGSWSDQAGGKGEIDTVPDPDQSEGEEETDEYGNVGKVREPTKWVTSPIVAKALKWNLAVTAGPFEKLGGFCGHVATADQSYVDATGTAEELAGTVKDNPPTGVPFFDDNT